ncbi:MAG: GlsB/YeaQ/YmgE family stress response membrane protein [Acidobacteriota bacterium]
MKEESMHGIIWWCVVGLIAGWLTGKLMKGDGFGFFGDIVIGILGALAGGFLMTHLGYAGEGGMIYTIIVATLGAVILTFLFRLVTKGRG